MLHEVQALSEGIERIREALDGGHFATAVEQLDICKKVHIGAAMRGCLA